MQRSNTAARRTTRRHITANEKLSHPRPAHAYAARRSGPYRAAGRPRRVRGSRTSREAVRSRRIGHPRRLAMNFTGDRLVDGHHRSRAGCGWHYDIVVLVPRHLPRLIQEARRPDLAWRNTGPFCLRPQDCPSCDIPHRRPVSTLTDSQIKSIRAGGI